MNRFKMFWFARTFSYFGDFVFSLTYVWFALEQGGAWEVAAVTGVTLLCRNFGAFLLVPVINYLGGRMTIVLSDMLRALINVVLWLLVFEHSSHPIVTIIVVALGAFIGGGFDGGMQVFIPSISSELRKANADLSSGRSTMQLLGAISGGVIWQFFAGFGFLVNALTFVVAGMISFYIGDGDRTAEKKIERKNSGGFWQRFAENWKIAWKTLQADPGLRLAFWTTIFINSFILPALSLRAPFVKDALGGGSIVFSMVQSASSVGSLIGAAVIRRSKWKDSYVLIISSLGCGIVGFAAGSSGTALLFGLTMVLFGFSQAMYNISENTMIQRNDPHLRASIYAILQVAGIVLYPVMLILLASLSSITSIRVPFLIGGAIVVVGTLFFAWRWFVAEADNRRADKKGDNAEVPM